MKILIKNGLVVDPANNRNEILDILIEDKRITRLAQNISSSADEVIDAAHRIVIPGIVDMHVHLREPGREDKETVASATRSALKGGVTSVLAMPNTQPAMDSLEAVGLLKGIIKKTAQANVFICGAITKERAGKELARISSLKKAGIVAISDDGSSVESTSLMLAAFKQAKKNKLPVICHSEDKNLSGQGVMNLGAFSTRLGLRGISAESEYRRVERDIHLAEKTRSRVHIAHVSCKESVELIAKAKKKGVKVTAETAPHYFTFTEEELTDYDTNKKMNPPLRGKDDVKALRQALKSGTIDVIASDHAPHTENEKDVEFERAEFGTIGLETLLAASVTELIHAGILDWPALVRKLTLNPAKILGIDKGTLSSGKEADITIIDPNKEWVMSKEDIASLSKNSAFLGFPFKGYVEYTICSGEIIYFSRQK
ncbi:MAG: dihydroorotase [Candidatus Omnitrophica bacterium]|nr:dihydroorotase [Candidatus Omnitrophota bacterium]MDD5236135.1 dihydroorotase [Candidatus Omnitrophota bacterium]MDD5611147.1 dihydroorotase [Candidatus Omnitrophota bacterium]